MKVTLKNVKINLTFSEETVMFKADLYIDGQKAGVCENGGRGGNTYYHSYGDSKTRKLIQECEVYYDSLPPVLYDDVELPRSLDMEIDEIIEKMVNEKEQKRIDTKMKKDMLTKLVLTNGNPSGYQTIQWGKGTPIVTILSTEQGRTALIDCIRRQKAGGFTILNTNIPEDILNS